MKNFLVAATVLLLFTVTLFAILSIEALILQLGINFIFDYDLSFWKSLVLVILITYLTNKFKVKYD